MQVKENGQPVRPKQKDEEQKGLGQREEEAPGSWTGSRDTSRLCWRHPDLGSPGILKKEKESVSYTHLTLPTSNSV